MTAEELTLETPYLNLAALRWNAGAPGRVLALHGWLDNAATFAELAPRLDGHEVVAIDLPGHGRSSHRPDGVHYHFVDFVPDVLAAGEALGWDRYAVLGHSLGAGVGCFAAAIAPERISGLALIEGLGPLSGAPADDPDRLAESTRQMAQHARRVPRIYRDRDAAVRARAHAGAMREASARRLIERAMEAVEGGFAWRSDARLRFRSPVYLTEAQVQAFLARVRCPALLLTGSETGFADGEVFAARCRAVGDLRHEEHPGGHHLHLDAAESLGAPIAAFLAGLPRA